MNSDPMETLADWWRSEGCSSTEPVPAPACLSTIGLDGHPNARFIDLKGVNGEHVMVTGDLSSRKGREIARNPKVAVTCWWPTTGRQVRIKGTAVPLSRKAAKVFFASRSRDAQLLRWVSRSGTPIAHDEVLRLLERSV